MGWSFRKSFRLGKGFRVNLSRRGLGWSIGGKALRFGVSGGKSRVSSGIGPFRFQKSLSPGTAAPTGEPEGSPKSGGCCGCLLILVAAVMVASIVPTFLARSRDRRAEEEQERAPRATAASPAASPRRPIPTGADAAASKARAVAKFPQLAIAGSPLNRAFVARVHEYQSARPSIFDDPEWPARIAEECAREAQTPAAAGR